MRSKQMMINGGCLKIIFNTEILRNRVAQSIDFQFYFLCVTQILCASVLKFFTFETASFYLLSDLKLRTARSSRKCNYIPDIRHAGNKLDHPFKPKAKACMGYSAEAPCI